ncbi:unnamed protein product [Didymodactylos carnosus]|uniref:tRNA pseudouridine(55) synthase n=1 Tax=Didymodactylos carnosus TaxID=1234261 RepID=A0A8S2CK84_9BILA|nr:unnamed protein product [Didymodactylos carnosus]CAF3496232.1 unnamed protein product [Didymodactylos carnosus]
MATGVLVLGLNESTKLLSTLINDNKQYLFEISFGFKTDSGDATGKQIEQTKTKITKQDLENKINQFIGEISQIPPMYSAIKVNGQKLYEHARRGEIIPVLPRKITIGELILFAFDERAQTAQLSVTCSKGTYVRTLAEDLAQAADFRFGIKRSGTVADLKQRFNVISVEVNEQKISTSQIEKFLSEGKIVEANQLLAEPFYLRAKRKRNDYEVDSRQKRDGGYIELLGTFEPFENKAELKDELILG